ncbi:MAG: nitrogenase [Clostridiales bacterium]|jgi:nitrogenase molybdenum-iron protein alpha chain|nr:nitrogenase [Clostridiales bacterium]
MMALQLHLADPPIREERLGSIICWNGDLEEMTQAVSCGKLEHKERRFAQAGICPNGCAASNLLSIRDVAVILHGPSGCSCIGRATVGRQAAARINKSYESISYGDDMDENDTIFGAVDSLKKLAIDVIEKRRPKALFIVNSCASAVIGEDIESLVSELTSEYDIPIGNVNCEGFKSQVWFSGVDAMDHAIVKTLVKEPKEKRDVVNFINFFESERKYLSEIFEKLGVKLQFLFVNSTVEEIEHLSEARATVAVCSTLGTYLGNALEQKYGVPFLKTINPMGMQGFEIWFKGIAAILGKQREARQIINQEREKYLPKIEKVKERTAGLKAVLAMGAGYSYEMARVLQELGIKILWLASGHLDPRQDGDNIPPAIDFISKNSANNFGTIISDNQNFEIFNILHQNQPDIFFSRHPGFTVWATKQNIPAVYVGDEYLAMGYKGTLALANMIVDAVTNRSFMENLSAHTKLPYTDWWLNQNHAAMHKEA